MKNICIALLLVLFFIIIGCKQEPVEVLPPELTISVSSENLKFGEEFTITWQTANATSIVTNFISTTDLTGSYTEKLIESKVFWIQAFNSEGLSIIKKVSVTVEPNEFDPITILLKYKWTKIGLDMDLGKNEDGSNSWVPYSNFYGIKYIFSADGSYIMLHPDDKEMPKSKDDIWSLDKDKKILTISGNEYKILSLTKEKMELYKFVTVNYFRDTYRADPK